MYYSHRNSVRSSVCPSDGHTDESVKSGTCKIGSPLLYSAVWKTIVSGSVKLFRKFERGHPEREWWNKRG